MSAPGRGVGKPWKATRGPKSAPFLQVIHGVLVAEQLMAACVAIQQGQHAGGHEQDHGAQRGSEAFPDPVCAELGDRSGRDRRTLRPSEWR